MVVLTTVVITTIVAAMKAPAKRAKGRAPVGSREEAAFLDLLRTCDLLTRRIAPVLKAADLTSTQYNVLRILRGAREGLACREIAARMITRDPDITRLLDRMEKRELIERRREAGDRRTVLTRITPEGLELLAGLDEPVQRTHRKHLGHLGPEKLRRLAELLREARGETA